jgi:hypothetical protein
VAANALRDDQKRLLRDMIDLEQLRRGGDPDWYEPGSSSTDDDEAAALESLAKLAAMPEEQVAEQYETIRAELDALEEAEDRKRQEAYDAAHPRP